MLVHDWVAAWPISSRTAASSYLHTHLIATQKLRRSEMMTAA